MEEAEKKTSVKEVLLEIFYILSPAVIEAGVFELLCIWIKDPRQWFIPYIICMVVSVLYTFLIIRSHTYQKRINKVEIALWLLGYYVFFTVTATLIGQLIFVNSLGMSGTVAELIFLGINLFVENLIHHLILAKVGKMVVEEQNEKTHD